MSATTPRLAQFEDKSTGSGINKKTTMADQMGWKPSPPPLYALKNIAKSNLWIDHEYQRDEISILNVNKIAANWRWECVGAIVVSLRSSGQFVVIEGQHRVLAAMKRADIEELPCIVFQFASQKQEAEAFLMVNTVRKTVSAIDKHRAGFVAENEGAIAAQELYDSMGITIARNPRVYNETKMVSNISSDISKYGKGPVGKTLEIMLELEASNGLKIELYTPLLHIIRRNPDKIEIIRKKLREAGHSLAMAKIKQTKALTGTGGYRPGMQALCEIINKGLRTNKVSMEITK